MKSRYNPRAFLPLIAIFALAGCADVADDFQMPLAANIKVHPPGFEDPAADNFHGTIIRNRGWDWDGCQQCHGQAPAFTGGTSDVSCATAGCHIDFQGQPKAVSACNTCHGDFRASANEFASFAPPRDLSRNTATEAVGVGAHQVHLRGGEISGGIRCSACHSFPVAPLGDEHFEPTGPDKVVFGGLAARDTELSDMEGNPPAYSADITAPSCSNTYCHGHFTGGNNFTPVWTVVDGSQAACGSCHGDPETGDPHPKTIAEGGTHLPGMINCQACHWLESDRPIARRLPDGTYVLEVPELHIDGNVYITGEEVTNF
jgi:predicted CxxxxCH...CXXCH cytochrome family protein